MVTSRSLKISPYRGYDASSQKGIGPRQPIVRGTYLGVSARDKELLEKFLEEESTTPYWQKRTDWFIKRINQLTQDWKGKAGKRTKDLLRLLSCRSNQGFARKEILGAVLPALSRASLFLDFLKKQGIISLENHQELFPPSRTKKRDTLPRQSEHAALNYVWRGNRRSSHCRFERLRYL